MMILQRDLTESLGHRVWWFKFSCLGNLSLVNWHPSRDSIAKLAMERAIRASIGSVQAGLAKALPASAHSWHDPNLVQDPTLNNWSLSYHPKPWIKNAYAKPYEWKMQERPPNCRKGQIVSAVDRSLNCQQHLFANLRNICQPWMFVDRILESPLVAHLQGMYKPCGMMGRSYLSEGSEFQFLYFVFCLVECSAWGRCFGLKPKTRPSSELLQQVWYFYVLLYWLCKLFFLTPEMMQQAASSISGEQREREGESIHGVSGCVYLAKRYKTWIKLHIARNLQPGQLRSHSFALKRAEEFGTSLDNRWWVAPVTFIPTQYMLGR